MGLPWDSRMRGQMLGEGIDLLQLPQLWEGLPCRGWEENPRETWEWRTSGPDLSGLGDGRTGSRGVQMCREAFCLSLDSHRSEAR